jgi:mannobiose 2-epimerase
MPRKFQILLLLAIFGSLTAQEADELRNELEYSLKNELLSCWYPGTIDSLYGGFLCDFSYDWKEDGHQHKMIVTQARHLWTLSQASIFFGDTSYHRIAKHAYIFLRDYMWDAEYGGFWQLLNRKGKFFFRDKAGG